MTNSFPNPVPNPTAYLGVRATNPPQQIVATRAPTTADKKYPLGTLWLDKTGMASYQLDGFSSGTAVWVTLGGGSSDVNTINNLMPTAGNITIAGTANQVAVANAGSTVTLSTPSAFIAPGSIASTTTVTGGTGVTATTGNISASAGAVSASTTVTAGTTITATLGNITATNGNFVSSTAGKGLQFNANTATGAAASPVVLNSRAGQVIFTSVSIAAAADLTLTITNSSVTASTTQIIYSMSGATTGSALSIKSVTNSSGSSVIVVTNGTGATTTTADITMNFIVVN